MPIGGGVFTTTDKVIPGVYVNFNDVPSSVFNASVGQVAWVVPTTEETKKNTIKEITRLNFHEGSYYPDADMYPKYIQDILVNAEKVWIISLKQTGTADAYSYETEKLKELLSSINYSVLLHLDHNGDGFVFKNIYDIYHEFIENSTKRYITVVDKEINTNTYKTDLEWYVQPHIKNSCPFIAGLLSNKDAGTSLSGTQYDGCIDASNWAVSLPEQQEELLKKGKVIFYSISTESPRILQDVTVAKGVEGVHFNLTTTQITRLKQNLYEFLAYTFCTFIQGKSNNRSYRDMFRSMIYDHLLELASINAIENVKSEDITVEPIEGQKNAIRVLIKIYPTVGIDFIYVTFEVN